MAKTKKKESAIIAFEICFKESKQKPRTLSILESFEHEPAKALKRFVYTLLQEQVTYEQLKQHLKLE